MQSAQLEAASANRDPYARTAQRTTDRVRRRGLATVRPGYERPRRRAQASSRRSREDPGPVIAPRCGRDLGQRHVERHRSQQALSGSPPGSAASCCRLPGARPAAPARARPAADRRVHQRTDQLVLVGDREVAQADHAFEDGAPPRCRRRTGSARNRAHERMASGRGAPRRRSLPAHTRARWS